MSHDVYQPLAYNLHRCALLTSSEHASMNLAAHLQNVCTGACRCAAKCIDAYSHEMSTLQLLIAALQAELNEAVSRQALALALRIVAAFALPIYNLLRTCAHPADHSPGLDRSGGTVSLGKEVPPGQNQEHDQEMCIQSALAIKIMT